MAHKFPAKTLLTGAAVFALSGAAAYGFAFNSNQQQPVTDAAFCPKMADEEAYKANRVQTYATLIPGQNGWIFRTKNDFRTDWTISGDTLAQFIALQNAMRTRNAELVIVMPPVRGMIHTKEMFEADKTKYGMDMPLDVWDAYERFISNARHAGLNIVGISRNEVNDHFFYKRNHHWSSYGARAAAQKVALTAKNLPAYTKIPKITYASQPLKPRLYSSSYERAFQKICGTQIQPEPAINYSTIPEDAASTTQALFEDNATPQVVLIGTSNSVNESSQANFDGFLKEYLSADVLNLAVTGAGIDTSLISYLNSDHYQNGQAKIVIWEIPGYYNLDTMNETVLRQAIPAAYGNCGENAIITKNFNNITNNAPIYASKDGATHGPFPIGQDPRHSNLEGNNNLYVHISFAKPMRKQFGLKFHYKDKEGGEGTTRTIRFKRSPRFPADGEFYTLFPQMGRNTELNKIRVTLPEKIKSADISMQVCALPATKHASLADGEDM